MDVQKNTEGTETKSMRLALKVLLLMSFTLSSMAQMEESLLKGSSEPPQDEGLASGRYQVREGSPSTVPVTSEVKPKVIKRKLKRKVSNTEPLATETKTSDQKLEVPKTPVNPEQPSVADQVKDLVMGNNQPTVEAYKEQVHPDDIRLNQVEINIDPGLIYSDSKSNYSFRNYNSFSPYAKVGAEVWLTPFIGVYGAYGTSVGADIVEDASTNSHVRVTHETTDIGFDFRKFFGLSRKSNSAEFGFHYFEDRFSVPGDDVRRVNTKSNGLGIHFHVRFPVAPTYSWILGGRMEPHLAHSEIPTGLNLQSGTSPESSRVGINMGGEFKLSRQNQVVWDLAVSIEKNQFSGPANLTDPETGSIPTGVAVTNATSVFTLGYRWGH